MMRFVMILLCALASTITQAQDSPKVLLAVDPLATPIRTMELNGFQTVGEAATYLLERVGFSLVIAPPAPVDAPFIADLPIRPSAINHEVKTMKEVLASMVGDKYLLYIDMSHKQVSFGAAEEKDYVQMRSLENVFTGRYIVSDPRL